MHYKTVVTCVYNGHVFYTVFLLFFFLAFDFCRFSVYSVVTTCQSNPPFSQFNSLCNEFMSIWSMFVYNSRMLKLLVMPNAMYRYHSKFVPQPQTVTILVIQHASFDYLGSSKVNPWT